MNTKTLYCSRCSQPQGQIQTGQLEAGARVICARCDDSHISHQVTPSGLAAHPVFAEMHAAKGQRK